MSSISTSRALAAEIPFAGRTWYYDFREINTEFGDKNCKRVTARLQGRYSKLTKAWTKNSNSEWTCRLFMAAKLIMSATLHVNSAYFAGERNLRVVVPYLRYYAVLSLLRAICYTIPECKWNDGQLIKISHAAAINETLKHLRLFDRTVADAAEIEIRELKAERELISYRAPSSGDDQVSEKNHFLDLCTLLAEVAQFNSEIFEASLIKHANPVNFTLLEDYLEIIACVEIEGNYYVDREDAYRLGYLIRKHPHPANLLHLMTEGHVDDFFGSWYPENDDDDFFNPDEIKQIIFDIP